jgi:hypothetical protein
MLPFAFVAGSKVQWNCIDSRRIDVHGILLIHLVQLLTADWHVCQFFPHLPPNGIKHSIDGDEPASPPHPSRAMQKHWAILAQRMTSDASHAVHQVVCNRGGANVHTIACG